MQIMIVTKARTSKVKMTVCGQTPIRSLHQSRMPLTVIMRYAPANHLAFGIVSFCIFTVRCGQLTKAEIPG
jgi:hypothetical protein